ncbi:hypothetical protein DENSPDRAFT_539319 [Dentipellis sp. KUC8613]|nr:hypothetical protein DENSPDRAFT_539319 [Dentipellis sp. KUC8613]
MHQNPRCQFFSKASYACLDPPHSLHSMSTFLCLCNCFSLSHHRITSTTHSPLVYSYTYPHRLPSPPHRFRYLHTTWAATACRDDSAAAYL